MVIGNAVLTVLGYSKLKDGSSLLSSIGRPVDIGSAELATIILGAILLNIGLLVFIIGLVSILDERAADVLVSTMIAMGILSSTGYMVLNMGLDKIVYRVCSIYNITPSEEGRIVPIPSNSTVTFAIVKTKLYFREIDRIIDKLSSPQMQPPYTQPLNQSTSQQTQVYSIGAGTLRGGVAIITIHSNQPVIINSAQLLGTQYVTYNITPNYLSVGDSTVEINFGNITLAEGVYAIRLTLSNGQYIDCNTFA